MSPYHQYIDVIIDFAGSLFVISKLQFSWWRVGRIHEITLQPLSLVSDWRKNYRFGDYSGTITKVGVDNTENNFVSLTPTKAVNVTEP